jgi:hypothetical protein
MLNDCLVPERSNLTCGALSALDLTDAVSLLCNTGDVPERCFCDAHISFGRWLVNSLSGKSTHSVKHQLELLLVLGIK